MGQAEVRRGLDLPGLYVSVLTPDTECLSPAPARRDVGSVLPDAAGCPPCGDPATQWLSPALARCCEGGALPDAVGCPSCGGPDTQCLSPALVWCCEGGALPDAVGCPLCGAPDTKCLSPASARRTSITLCGSRSTGHSVTENSLRASGALWYSLGLRPVLFLKSLAK